MNLKDIAGWNKKVSAVYAAGIWTMICSFVYYKYTGRFEDMPAIEDVEEPEDSNKHVYRSAHNKTIIVYKKDFVPYSTRIYNLIKSFSGGPGPGDSDK
ncbi:small integral membrane protein 26-like [Melanotaenia boesemani]|uniref:small integral membrane protein 26-like n=1 Tax=Melanotaenia boesemani TaxID=1250792 RepID=UPI001C045EED|nr:small integral membrane protein 26-like [Melanotaenia boesemani]